MIGLRLHVIYRSTGSENRKRRPAYYSKLSSLRSFLRAREACPDAGELLFLCDGPIPRDRLELMTRAGTIVALGGIGGQEALVAALRQPGRSGWPDDDLVYLAEDDYLYRPEAFAALVEAARSLPEIDYFAFAGTLRGAGPDDFPPERDLRFPHVAPATLREGWRAGLSHTGSFAVRPAAVRRDLRLHRIALRAGGTWDHSLSLAYQGLAPFTPAETVGALRAPGLGSWSRRGKVTAWRLALTATALARRRDPHALAIADPPLATHVETGVISPGTDWEAEAARLTPT